MPILHGPTRAHLQCPSPPLLVDEPARQAGRGRRNTAMGDKLARDSPFCGVRAPGGSGVSLRCAGRDTRSASYCVCAKLTAENLKASDPGRSTEMARTVMLMSFECVCWRMSSWRLGLKEDSPRIRIRGWRVFLLSLPDPRDTVQLLFPKDPVCPIEAVATLRICSRRSIKVARTAQRISF